MTIIETDITVLTGPAWLFEMFNGYRNEKGTAEIRPVIDPDGDPIIGMEVLNDTTWDFLADTLFPNPDDPQDRRTIRGWLRTKKYKYIQQEI